MIRQRCNATTDFKRCEKTFRARKNYQFCREHHRILYGNSRPIESREEVHGGYRRTKSRRHNSAPKAVPKVIQNRNKAKNANS